MRKDKQSAPEAGATRVKLGNTQREQMTSAVHPTTDIAKILRHFRFVPGSEVAIHGSEQRLSDPHNAILRRYSETHRRAVSHCIRGSLGRDRAG